MAEPGGAQLDAIADAVRMILEGIGEDVEREGLRDTPQRVARMYAEVFGGLTVNPADVVSTVFDDENHEDRVAHEVQAAAPTVERQVGETGNPGPLQDHARVSHACASRRRSHADRRSRK